MHATDRCLKTIIIILPVDVYELNIIILSVAESIMAENISTWVEQPWQNPSSAQDLLPWTPYDGKNEDDNMGY